MILISKNSTSQISDGVESLEVGDHAVFLSKFWSRLPYLGKIVDLWQTSGGRMKVKINWLYHKDEVQTVTVGEGGAVQKILGLVFRTCYREIT